MLIYLFYLITYNYDKDILLYTIIYYATVFFIIMVNNYNYLFTFASGLATNTGSLGYESNSLHVLISPVLLSTFIICNEDFLH